ncbi:MAG: malto-oligosyltrehalose trehalohydrolase [Candidatus Tectomicrobia bacterium]|uniref:Malto-oligosyltrehalose trehalohydrolase n=1 Tax=Tectimicrobiota bacterium TaxID=2528274 RepID=A0A933LQI4_UNCTE|nr:malto-oligosyltrehalose trehalohydrolase [Candidatus Tectomicrobia bacterium]
MRVGASYQGNGKCEFVVWAPFLSKVNIKLLSPYHRVIPMEKDSYGYWKACVEKVLPDTKYFYCLEEERDRPDPASHFQPEGVHGPSQVIDHILFPWADEEWRGIDISQMVIYELHVGTFTQEGTFEAIVSRLEGLREVGINTIELMPVAQFPGERNWGYDGVYPYAVQNSYGGPEGLKKLVARCHKEGLAVILDVVYNHLGPEGNYLWDYGPYFTDKYKTLWGKAINFDDAYSDEVRNFFIENPIHWFQLYHIDALRLDATHAIFDMSAKPFLQELGERVGELVKLTRKRHYLIAESNLNDARMVKPRALGGYGMDALWCDDFHHSLRTLLTREHQGYYLDFGKTEHLVKSLREGFVYSGQYSQYRKRKYGSSSKDRHGEQFIVFSQNHDQVGNRRLGERLSSLVSFEALKLAAGSVLLSPYIPLLFMGEEFGAETPFLYFISHSDPDLIRAVREGRRKEFEAFDWKGHVPEPDNLETFLQSKVNWEKRMEGRHKVLLGFYKNLIELRKNMPALSNLDKDSREVWGLEKDQIIVMRRWEDDNHLFILFNFSSQGKKLTIPLPEGRWKKRLDSSEKIWDGPGSPIPERIDSGDEIMVRGHSFAMFMRE